MQRVQVILKIRVNDLHKDPKSLSSDPFILMWGL